MEEPPKANKDEVCDGGEVKLKEAAAGAESVFPLSEDPPFVDFLFKKSNAPDETPFSPPVAGLLKPANPENRLGPPS